MTECAFVCSYMNEVFTLMHGMEHIKYMNASMFSFVSNHILPKYMALNNTFLRKLTAAQLLIYVI